MEYTIPSAGHRLTLEHDSKLDGSDAGFQQGQKQNAEIIAYAQSLELGERYVPVEVFYERSAPYRDSTTEADFDAVLVDTEEEKIVSTLPPYDEIDPEWKEKREAQNV